MISWRQIDCRPLCIFYAKPDFVLTGRSYRSRGGKQFAFTDSQYADDTALLFPTRLSLEQTAPHLIRHFSKFGLSIHVGTESIKSKTVTLFVSAPLHTYEDPVTFDNQNLSDIVLSHDSFLPIVDEFCYLGSIITRDCSDDRDVLERIKKASNAFGALRKIIFANRNVAISTKKYVYESLILPILLYGTEAWSLTEKLYHKLRVFHHSCLRVMNRITRLQTWENRISNQDLLYRMNLLEIDTYIVKRQLQWAGHVSRMDFDRLPRKMLSCWVRNKRPIGCPRFTYGRGLSKALKKANIDVSVWSDLASERNTWRKLLNALT